MRPNKGTSAVDVERSASAKRVWEARDNRPVKRRMPNGRGGVTGGESAANGPLAQSAEHDREVGSRFKSEGDRLLVGYKLGGDE